MRRLVLCLSLLAACERNEVEASSAPSATATAAPEEWPPLPADAAALEALVGQHEPRPELGAPPNAAAVMRSLRAGIEKQRVHAGWRSIARELSRLAGVSRAAGQPRYFLFGSFHDAPAQVDAFSHLVGPLGIEPAPLLALEQLQSTGHYPDVAAHLERGDDEALKSFFSGRGREAFDALVATQLERNYTAWKYGYGHRFVDLLMAARGGDREVIGCDMPSALQAHLRKRLGEASTILRDVHCARTLRARRPEGPVALFWGDAHLAPDRLPRFLPPEAQLHAIHLVGGRTAGLEAELSLALTDPLLVPLSEHAAVLLLPEAPISIAAERVRRAVAPDARHTLGVIGFEGEIAVGGTKAPVGTPIPLPPGDHAFVLEAPRPIAGHLVIPQGGDATISLEDGVVRIEEGRPGH